jgi:glycerophosphoryl diester phosphodiesterase
MKGRMVKFIAPKLIGHRGACASSPENTLASLVAASKAGCTWVEFDATLSQDGVPVLFHDDALDRTSNGQGPVAMAKLAHLKSLDAGSWFSPIFKGEPIPTLADALALCRALGLHVNIEIKPAPGQDHITARTVLEVALQLWPNRKAEPPLISSFSVESLMVAKELAPHWPRGYLIWDAPPNWLMIADKLGASTLNIAHDREDMERLKAYLACNRPVLAYTVNDLARARALLAMGLSGVFTDDPQALAPLLALK